MKIYFTRRDADVGARRGGGVSAVVQSIREVHHTRRSTVQRCSTQECDAIGRSSKGLEAASLTGRSKRGRCDSSLFTITTTQHQACLPFHSFRIFSAAFRLFIILSSYTSDSPLCLEVVICRLLGSLVVCTHPYCPAGDGSHVDVATQRRMRNRWALVCSQHCRHERQVGCVPST